MKSRHYFLHHPSDQVEFIKQLNNVFCDLNDNQNWFYIRYWLGGPHVRVRFQGDDTYFDKLRFAFNNSFLNQGTIVGKNEYYKNHIFDGKKENVENLPFYCNGTVIDIEYIPEMDRYGEGEVLRLSEEIFKASSEYCVEIMNISNHPYFTILGGILIFEEVLKNVSDRSAFLERYIFYWSSMAHEGNYLSDEIISHIILKCNKFNMDGTLKIRFEKLKTAIKSLKSIVEQESFDYIMSSQIHMNNNRLGIVPSMEARIASCIKGIKYVE